MPEHDDEVVAIRRLIAEAEQRLVALEADRAATPRTAASENHGPSVAGRRRLLRLTGAAVVGGVAALATASGRAAAGTGPMTYGDTNNSGADETQLSSSSQLFTLRVNNSSQFATTLEAVNTSSGTAFSARTEPDTGARAVDASVNGSNGYAVAAVGGRSQLYLSQGFSAGPEVAGSHSEGELAAAGNGLWYCAATGSPGTWRKLASATTAGAFHPIATARVYDSRWTGILPNVIKGPMVVGGASRLVYCDDKRALATGLVETADIVPTGATAIAYNLTVTTTTGQGYLAVEPGGAASFGGSAINWSPGPVSLANASVAKLDTQRRVSVFVGGQPASSTHFIIDVVGYYL